MEQMDGSFSEGGALNAHGLLGMRSTSILWTYSKAECCGAKRTPFMSQCCRLYTR
jgi:hypothetical protein